MNQCELMELMKTALDGCNQISHWDRSDEWYEQDDVADWKEACKLKDRAIALFDKRWQAAIGVIDLIAEELGLSNKGYYLYAPQTDDRHPIIDEIRGYVAKSGDKAKLKKQIAELEHENAVLRKIIRK